MLVKAEGTGKSPAEAHVCPGTSSGTKSDVQDVPVTAGCRCTQLPLPLPLYDRPVVESCFMPYAAKLDYAVLQPRVRLHAAGVRHAANNRSRRSVLRHIRTRTQR